ncbi:MAG: hypothetical protein EON58_01030 [Alphaproteobacteria bacterium]|nr:MAG: hypothetical protein EON58_01030 [Alphaproteobacteria bacterium]
MRSDQEFYEGFEPDEWAEEIEPTSYRLVAPGPGWAKCTGFALGDRMLHAGISVDNRLMVDLSGRDGVQRTTISTKAVIRLLDPLSRSQEELTSGLVLLRREARVHVIWRGEVLGTVDSHLITLAWGLHPAVALPKNTR